MLLCPYIKPKERNRPDIEIKTDQHVVVEELLDAVGLAAAVEEPGDDHGQLKVVEFVDANLAKDRW